MKKFAKGDLIIEINNPVCESLFLKQGWVPVVDEGFPLTAEAFPVIDEPIENKTVEVTEETIENGQLGKIEVVSRVYKKGDFTTLSIEKIKELAESLGYKITAIKKADIIEEFLTQQK